MCVVYLFEPRCLLFVPAVLLQVSADEWLKELSDDEKKELLKLKKSDYVLMLSYGESKECKFVWYILLHQPRNRTRCIFVWHA